MKIHGTDWASVAGAVYGNGARGAGEDGKTNAAIDVEAGFDGVGRGNHGSKLAKER